MPAEDFVNRTLGQGWFRWAKGAITFAAVWTMGTGTAALAQGLPCRYEVDYIYAPQCTADTWAGAQGLGISDEGDICGFNYLTCPPGFERSFIAWGAGSLSQVPIPGNPQGQAWDVQAGAVVGHYVNQVEASGFRYASGIFTNIPSLPEGNYVQVSATNSFGVVVGAWGSNQGGPWGYPRAFRWQSGVMEDLGAQFPPIKSRAFASNENGAITGFMAQSLFPSNAHAFILDHGTLTDLGLMSGSIGTEGRAINVHNEVVGIAWFVASNSAGYVRRGFFWKNGVFTDLGMMPGYTEMFPGGITDDGLVVAEMTDGPGPNNRDAVIWKAGILRKIKPLLGVTAPFVVNPYGPHGVNASGQIAASAWKTGPGIHISVDTAIRLRPVARRPGDTNCDQVVNTTDLLSVIQNWHGSGVDADVNADWTVNVQDLLLVIANWG